MNSKKRIHSRRSFLKKAAATAGTVFIAPSIVPVRGYSCGAPSEKINIGCIGVGRMGLRDMREVMGFNEARIVAVCDVDFRRLTNASNIIENYYASRTTAGSYKGCAQYTDFRKLINRKDVDAVLIATPDHWHGLVALEAAANGKDIFLQKPLTLTIRQGRVLSDAVRKRQLVFQVGSQQRSDANFRFACELVRNGRIGELKTVKVGIGIDPVCETVAPMSVPDNLDYDMWLGPAPKTPYTEKRVHPQQDYSRPGWLRISDYCLGMITGWGSHHNDIAQWGMGTEYTGPVEISGQAEFPSDGLWDAHGMFRIHYKYANGVELICTDNITNRQGVVFEGMQGWIYVKRGYIETHPRSLVKTTIGSEEKHLYESNDHKKNFLDCIKQRRQTVAPVEVGHRSNSVCVLGYIAMKLGRKLKWDPDSEQFLNDAAANKMLSRPMRSPWRI